MKIPSKVTYGHFLGCYTIFEHDQINSLSDVAKRCCSYKYMDIWQRLNENPEEIILQ